MLQYRNTVVDFNGEGLMLRKHQSLYEEGRSQSILKAKVLDPTPRISLTPTRSTHTTRTTRSTPTKHTRRHSLMINTTQNVVDMEAIITRKLSDSEYICKL